MERGDPPQAKTAPGKFTPYFCSEMEVFFYHEELNQSKTANAELYCH